MSGEKNARTTNAEYEFCFWNIVVVVFVVYVYLY